MSTGNELVTLKQANDYYKDLRGRQEAFVKSYEKLTFPINKGTLCVYDGLTYISKQDISNSEPWTSSHWTETNISDELTDVKNAIQGKYTKPSGGIPATDMTEEVQNTLSAVGKSEERDGIVQNGDTATRNITKDQYVVWKGNLYTASANIATGETLSLSNLDPVSDGGFNALHDEIEQKHRIKAYKKVTIQEQVVGQWIELDGIVDIEDGDEIEIIIYQSDTSQGTKWSNSDQWNSCAVQNRNGTMSISVPYLYGTKPADIIIKKAQGYATSKTITNNTIQLCVSFPNDFDNFRRIKIDPTSSTFVAGCTVEITVRKTI